MKKTFHILGLVHLPVSKQFLGCAFTMKIWRLSKALHKRGHTVYLYGAEGSDESICTELIQTHTMRDIRQTWGSGDNRDVCTGLGYDWKREGFRHDINGEPTTLRQRFNRTVVREINKRKSDDDFLLISQGAYQKPIADAVGLELSVESGIGYRGSFAKYRVFESTYIRNFTLGSMYPYQSINGNYYWRTIPNYFDSDDFMVSDQPRDYYFFIGRLIDRKGFWTAVKATKALGAKLVVAGQGDVDFSAYPHVEFVGYVDGERKKELFAGAIATFVPTTYLEPFAGTHAESLLSGTPVISTAFGAFPEFISDGFNGYQCHTLDDFVQGAKDVKDWDHHQSIRDKAVKRYDISNVVDQYERYFDDLHRLWQSQQDSNVKAWHYVDKTTL